MNIFSLEIRNIRKTTLKWTLAMAIVVLGLLAFFPSMQTEAMQQLANAKLTGIDPAILAALGLSNMLDFTVITNFFGYVLQFLTLAIMVYATHQAVSTLVKEETDGTIEYLYAKPIGRTCIFTYKLLAVLAAFAAMLLVLTVITLVGYLSFSDYTFSHALRETAIMYGAIFFVGLVFMSVGMLLSTLIKSNRGASGVTIAIVFGTFVLGIVGVLVNKLKFLQYLSPMDWIKTGKLLSTGLTTAEWITGFGVIVCALVAALLYYQRKDFAA